MLRLGSNTKRIDTFFVMMLFFLFALTAFVLVLIGAKQYNITAYSMNYNYEVRTATSYIREKVRQNDCGTRIHVENIDGIDALALESEINNSTYSTYIYFYDGYMRELFVQQNSPFTLETGQQIIEISGLNISAITNRLIHITIFDTFGDKSELYLSVNSTE